MSGAVSICAGDQPQRYLYENPDGYRCHSSTGVPFPA